MPVPQRAWIFVSLLLLIAAAPAAAQTCLGRAIGGLAGHAVVGQLAYAGYDLDQRVNGIDLGAAYWGNPGGLAAYSAGYNRRFMRDGGADLDVANVRAVAELPRVRPLPPGAGACLTLGAAAARASGEIGGADFTAYAFPIGLAIGFTLPAGPASRLYPYLHPQVVIARSDGEAFGFEFSERYTALVVDGGIGFARGPLVGRLRILLGGRPDEAGIGPLPDLRAGIEAGIRF